MLAAKARRIERVPLASLASTERRRLHSWEEIAACLRDGVRSEQPWEETEGEETEGVQQARRKLQAMLKLNCVA
jgi:hypothetical protein